MPTSLFPDFHRRLFQARPLREHVWDGKLIRGDEPDERLREIALATSLRCPEGQDHARCPFRWLEALTEGQRMELVEHLDRNALLQLFAMEQACRFEVNHPRAGTDTRPPAP